MVISTYLVLVFSISPIQRIGQKGFNFQARNLTYYTNFFMVHLIIVKKSKLKFNNVVINLRRLSLVFMLRLSALFVINRKQGS